MTAYFKNLFRPAPDASVTPPPMTSNVEDSSPEQMIASCEYELRQMRRDLQRTRDRSRPSLAQLMAQTKPEPFRPGARQRLPAVPASPPDAAVKTLKSA
jgi:hypothetical protein